MHFHKLSRLALLFLISGCCVASAIAQPATLDKPANPKSPTSHKLKSDELGSTPKVHSFGSVILAGQPSPEDLKLAAERGVTTVITLRDEGELDWDESEAVKNLDLDFYRFEIGSQEPQSADGFDHVLKVLAEKQGEPILLHCGSAGRVGAVWLAHRVLNDGIDIESAREEAKEVGLSSPKLEEKTLAYIQQQMAEREKTGDTAGSGDTDSTKNAESSVKPGINEKFVDPKLDVTDWMGRFEIESREVYHARERVLAALNLEVGQSVADIGAGTGFFSRLFASKVGTQGWVYAVDISARFLEHINQQAQDDHVDNLTCVLGTDRSICLPPESIDVAFTCDTYHHFEYPDATLASIHKALKPGGTFVVVDFERIPGKSKQWLLDHVRAGKLVVRKEIENAGFEFVEEVNIPEFEENYFLRFRKLKPGDQVERS